MKKAIGESWVQTRTTKLSPRKQLPLCFQAQMFPGNQAILEDAAAMIILAMLIIRSSISPQTKLVLSWDIYSNYPAFCNITQSQNGRCGTFNMDEHGTCLLSLWRLDGLLLCRLRLQQPCGSYTLWNKPVWLAHQHHHHHFIFEVKISLLQSENIKRRYTRTCCCWRLPYLLQVNPPKIAAKPQSAKYLDRTKGWLLISTYCHTVMLSGVWIYWKQT